MLLRWKTLLNKRENIEVLKLFFIKLISFYGKSPSGEIDGYPSSVRFFAVFSQAALSVIAPAG